MATRNDITGDSLISKGTTKAYRDNYERIFGNKKKESQTASTGNRAQGEKASISEVAR